MNIAHSFLAFLLLALGSCMGGMTVSSGPVGTPQTTSAAPSLAPVESGAPSVAPVESGAPSIAPVASGVPGSPAADAAYLRLLSTIPEPVRASCEPTRYTEAFPPEPGELATADCTISGGPDGEYVSYTAFDSEASMDAFYDIQLKGTTILGGLDGPGCFTGPGADSWPNGRRFCFQILGDDANVRWTHEALSTVAIAVEQDGDWSKLGVLWESAGPIAP